MATALVFGLVLLLAVVIPLLLWQATEAETAGGEVLNREDAERRVRTDAAEPERRDSGTDTDRSEDEESGGWEFDHE